MKKLFIVLFFLALVTTIMSSVAYAQRAVFLVRHADRLNKSEDSPLSKAGEMRSQLLANLLKDAGITAIYTTPAKSSGLLIKTAEPLALALKINPVSILDGEEFLKRPSERKSRWYRLDCGNCQFSTSIVGIVWPSGGHYDCTDRI